MPSVVVSGYPAFRSVINVIAGIYCTVCVFGICTYFNNKKGVICDFTIF
jgi:hypothetical protein